MPWPIPRPGTASARAGGPTAGDGSRLAATIVGRARRSSLVAERGRCTCSRVITRASERLHHPQPRDAACPAGGRPRALRGHARSATRRHTERGSRRGPRAWSTDPAPPDRSRASRSTGPAPGDPVTRRQRRPPRSPTGSGRPSSMPPRASGYEQRPHRARAARAPRRPLVYEVRGFFESGWTTIRRRLRRVGRAGPAVDTPRSSRRWPPRTPSRPRRRHAR